MLFKPLLLNLITKNTFMLASQFYKQICGCTMTRPFSVIFSGKCMSKTTGEAVDLFSPKF